MASIEIRTNKDISYDPQQEQQMRLLERSQSSFLVKGGREVKYQNLEVYTMEHCPYTLVGIAPVFEDYNVTILASQKRFKLEPRK
jgi:hypothetical protein